MPAAFEVRGPQANGGLRVAVCVPPKPRLVERPRSPERPLFADSLLDFGKSQTNRRKFATAFSFYVSMFARRHPADYSSVVHRGSPPATLLTLLVAPPPPPPPPAARAVSFQIRAGVHVRVARRVCELFSASGSTHGHDQIFEKEDVITVKATVPGWNAAPAGRLQLLSRGTTFIGKAGQSPVARLPPNRFDER